MPAGRAEIETGAVVALTHEGDGIVREGKAVFVPGALPGELIRFRRRAQHRQYDDGLLLEVLEKSSARVTPACAYFGICGGCALQHLAPAAQLAAKELELRDNLERVARVAPRAWLPRSQVPLGLPAPRAPEREVRRQEGAGARWFSRARKPYVSAIAAVKSSHRAPPRSSSRCPPL
jgi:tRNA/tmRNA/rRNA uracil-C5-methylase (TrmA/RlmC/RlmD family)